MYFISNLINKYINHAPPSQPNLPTFLYLHTYDNYSRLFEINAHKYTKSK